MRTTLEEMVQPQPPNTMAKDNSVENIIVNGGGQTKGYREIDMMFYWVCDRFRKKCFHIF